MQPGKVTERRFRELNRAHQSKDLLRGKSLGCWRESPGQETDITFALLSIVGRRSFTVFRWRMVGERKRPETQPTFCWVMDIFGKAPSSAAVLKVTELTLSTNSINGIVDISVSSFVFFFLFLFSYSFYASHSEEWLQSACRLSDVCCAAKAQRIRHEWNCMKFI